MSRSKARGGDLHDAKTVSMHTKRVRVKFVYIWTAVLRAQKNAVLSLLQYIAPNNKRPREIAKESGVSGCIGQGLVIREHQFALQHEAIDSHTRTCMY